MTRTIPHSTMALYFRWLNEAIEQLNRCSRAHDGGTDEWAALITLNTLRKNLLNDCVASIEITTSPTTGRSGS